MALKLESNNARAHLQLGVTLMAKQDGHAAAIALMEAILLDPELIHAHYSLGSVQYSLGHLTAAIQSYRQALDLQPNFPDARYRLALVLKLTNRRRALSPDQSERRRKDAIEAFRQYRDDLWADYPDAVRNDPSESLGIDLLRPSAGHSPFRSCRTSGACDDHR